MALHHVEHEGVRVQVRIEGAALSMPEDCRCDLAGRDVALVDAASVLVAGEGFEFAQGFGDGSFVRGHQSLIAADERLD